ncbi:MAG: HPr family phosphocarrier protein [Spirochaetaceae bacterium]|jgi:phosphocarrier protein|nr:HPr family phosphocarrier protein [Spirochaetaceae bacterium]
MVEKKVVVANRAGIHARPASIIVEKTKNFKSSIHFEHGETCINAKSILGIITLGAAYNTQLTITADGEDEEAAIAALTHLFESKFEED